MPMPSPSSTTSRMATGPPAGHQASMLPKSSRNAQMRAASTAKSRWVSMVCTGNLQIGPGVARQGADGKKKAAPEGCQNHKGPTNCPRKGKLPDQGDKRWVDGNCRGNTGCDHSAENHHLIVGAGLACRPSGTVDRLRIGIQ